MAQGIDDAEYYIHQTGTVNTNTTWTSRPYWQSTTYIDTTESEFETGHADPDTCNHEWWEDTYLMLTTHPACYKQVCKLCGSIRYRQEDMPVFSPRWKRVY